MSEWINVDEQLPEDDVQVQIYWSATRCDYAGQSVASRGMGQWGQSNPCNGGTLWDHLVKVTHWKPLTTPPAT